MPDLETFFKHLTEVNPFAINRVVDPSAREADAETIHEPEFRRLTTLARQARDHSLGIGAVLWGEAGVGKSHLLARLGRWARDHPAYYVYLYNLQTQAENLPGLVLKCVISSLTLGRTRGWTLTPLYRLVAGAILAALRPYGLSRSLWPTYWTVYQSWVEQLVSRSSMRAEFLDRTAYDVLFRFCQSAYEARKSGTDDGVAWLAVQWLAGSPLEPGDAAKLGVRSLEHDEGADPRVDDAHIKQVFVALTRLAASAGQPFLLGFDQVDNLDEDKMKVLSRFLQDLLDSSGNLLVVTAGVRQTLLSFRETGAVTEAAWDRMARHQIELGAIRKEQARQILEKRLEQALGPFEEVHEVKERMMQDSLFPLGASWLERRLGDKIEVRPRDVVSWADDRWQEQRDQIDRLSGQAWLESWPDGQPILPPPPPRVSREEAVAALVLRKLTEQTERRHAQPQLLPPDEANLAELTLLALCQLLKSRPNGPIRVERVLPLDPNHPSNYQLLVRYRHPATGREYRTGVLFLVASQAWGTTKALRRVMQDPHPPDRLVLVLDQRMPIVLGQSPEAKGRQFLKELQQRPPDRFLQLELTFDEIAELDAMQAVTGQSRAGDLEVKVAGGGLQPISEAEVVAAFEQQGRYRKHRLLSCLLEVPLAPAAPPAESPAAPPAPVPAGPGDLTRFLEQHRDRLGEFIVNRLALNPGAASEELAEVFVQEQVQEDLAICHQGLVIVARELHEAKRIHATPRGEGLYLLRK